MFPPQRRQRRLPGMAARPRRSGTGAATETVLRALPPQQLWMAMVAMMATMAPLDTARADCWSVSHPDDPRPELLAPIVSGWRRPAWSHVPGARPPPPLPAAPPRVCNVLRHGGRGDGRTLNTAAITAAIAECRAAGGGTVLRY
jgi:hypothetical protein